ncbi:MAG: MFS transporter [Thermoguttaceae bacterium]|jgi:ACS family hexuronate transporter-like MFS transporter
MTHYRWVICALLFCATTIIYVDRGILGVLQKDFLMGQLGWNKVDYGLVSSCFSAGYALGFLFVGGLIDRIGVRRGLFFAFLVWSVVSVAHGLIGSIPAAAQLEIEFPGWFATLLGWCGSSATGVAVATTVAAFAAARFLLAFSEAGNFPGSIKAVSEWFPKRERALATGIFNAGSNVGAIAAPLAVPLIAAALGWQAAFYATGLMSLVWVAFWMANYRAPDRHARVSAAELACIRCDGPESGRRMRWWPLLGRRQTWAFALPKLLLDPCWWFYLIWLPGFFQEKHGLDIQHIGLPLVTIYLMADVGSIAGGWLSSRLIKIGWTVNRSRKTALLICALCVVPIFLAADTSNLWVAVGLIGLAAAAHQGFSANLFTVVSDTVPRQAVSSVVGIGGTVGAIGGMLLPVIDGYILKATNNDYHIPLLIPSAAYLVALASMHLILPRLDAMKIES